MTSTTAWTSCVDACLEELERRIIPAEEERLRAEWVRFYRNETTDDVFCPCREKVVPASREFPAVHINDAQHDFEAMAYSELRAAQYAFDRHCFPCVRCNYGVGILPSLFGTPIKIMEEQFNLLPTSMPLGGGAIRALVDQGVPDVHAGLGGKVLDMAAHFVERMRPYPNVSKYVRIYHPDLQGPMDVCELIWGSDMFCDLVDEPELAHDFLSLICDAYSALLRAFADIVPFEKDYNVHWGYLIPGTIMLRDDSAMNLSPAMFDEFIRPYDQRLFDEWGGGAVHYCGRGDHFVPSMATMRGISLINLSQPHLNDMETIYRATVDKGVPLLMSADAARASIAAGRDLHRRIVAC